MLTPPFLRCVEDSLGKKLGQKIHIRRVSPVSGGSINQAAKIETTLGTYFLKCNDAFQFPQMFEKESRGLEALRSINKIMLPKVILTGDEEGQSFLILEYIESKMRSVNFWQAFGKSLAEIHRNTSQRFGFAEDNYIGSLHQSNKEHNRWNDFFIEERLEKQLRLAISKGKMNDSDRAAFTRLFSRIDSIIPEEPPALLHGDLWNGNFMTGSNGEPCLIDPAVYFGHREMDLAMSKLFGGFDEEFYEAYNNEYPLASGFDDRVEVYNLYPLLVHVNLFGGGYVSTVRQILKRYS